MIILIHYLGLAWGLREDIFIPNFYWICPIFIWTKLFLSNQVLDDFFYFSDIDLMKSSVHAFCQPKIYGDNWFTLRRSVKGNLLTKTKKMRTTIMFQVSLLNFICKFCKERFWTEAKYFIVLFSTHWIHFHISRTSWLTLY